MPEATESRVVSTHTGFSINNFLPSIYSILKTVKTEDAGLKNTGSIRSKIGLLLNSPASLYSAATTTHTPLSANTQPVTTGRMNDGKEEHAKWEPNQSTSYFRSEMDEEMFHKYQKTGSNEEQRSGKRLSPCLGLAFQTGIIPMLGQNIVANPSPQLKTGSPSGSYGGKQGGAGFSRDRRGVIRKLVDNWQMIRSRVREESESKSEATLFSNGIRNQENIVIEANYNPEQQAFEERFMTTGSNQNKHYSKIELSSRLATPDDARRTAGQLWNLQDRINDNLETDYFHTTPMHAERETDKKGFLPRSELSERLPNRHACLADFEQCFVNSLSEQVQPEGMTNEIIDESFIDYSQYTDTAAFGNNTYLDGVLVDTIQQRNYDAGQVDWLQQNNYPEEHQSVREEHSLISIAANASSLSCKGLQHYDPLSGAWYESLSPTRRVDMFSVIDSSGMDVGLFDELREVEKTQERVQSNLVWHDLHSDAAHCAQASEHARKQRRKIGNCSGPERNTGHDDGQVPRQQNWVKDEVYHNQHERPQVANNDDQHDGFEHTYDTAYRHQALLERQGMMCRGGEELCNSDDDRENFQAMERYVERNQHYRGLQGFEEAKYDYDCLHSKAMEDSMNEANVCHPQGGVSRASLGYREDTGSFFDSDQGRVCDRNRGYTDRAPWYAAGVPRPYSDQFCPERRKSLTDSPLSLSSGLASLDSSCQSEVDSTDRSSSLSSNSKRRRSMLERQYRVEIPEQVVPKSQPVGSPKMQLNPLFIIEENQCFDSSDDRGNPDGDTDILAVARRKISCEQTRPRNLPYGESFSQNENEAEQIRQQDVAIMEQQMKNYLKMSHHHPGIEISDQIKCYQVFTGEEQQQLQSRRVDQLCVKREDTTKRPGIRRFSTPSMESWTSTPEKYYYDATGDNCISEEEICGDPIRKEKQQQQSFIGRGRAKEYTTRFLKGVSPKIRRHSTSVMGRQDFTSASGNSGTFLGKIGEGKFVQTIQTKLGRKESRSDEPKSPKLRDQERNLEDDKSSKGSPLNAIRNKLYLLSGGK